MSSYSQSSERVYMSRKKLVVSFMLLVITVERANILSNSKLSRLVLINKVLVPRINVTNLFQVLARQTFLLYIYKKSGIPTVNGGTSDLLT